ncbi:MAG TPA: 7-carboxy-7-deazaguanine synthase QueE [Opitutae bacterium]|nr:radical SAM protein [Puniceicoccaceae bacterium]HBR94470.1 7-carboxy-7-deazaguanine synthase QueE [Opitutae bacterium]|tara:strand:+ start:11135 stop:11803 length:669 start_codon:yes stop_codon:yes gene_type:complete
MLPIHEQFYTFQGEGAHAGRAAYFIRTFGCPVHCPWCDSAGTWHPDYIPKKVQRSSVESLVTEVAKTKAEFVVITGGEPAIHNLQALVDALHAIGQTVHLETSGAFEIKGNFDWITLSPKRWKLPLAVNLERASEFKIIVDQAAEIEEYSEVIGATTKPVWLHPEWSKHNDAATLDAITEWVKTQGAPYRAGWQMHKHYAADLKDSRSAPAAPLGGDPKLGF